MFNNAGLKIKSYAKTLFVLDCIGCAILAICGFIFNSVLLFLIYAAILLLASYVGCLMLATFGEIAATLYEINRKLPEPERHSSISQTIATLQNTPAPVSEKKPAPVNVTVSEKRGKVIDGKTFVSKDHATIICPWCETEQPSGGDKCTNCSEKFHYAN